MSLALYETSVNIQTPCHKCIVPPLQLVTALQVDSRAPNFALITSCRMPTCHSIPKS